MPATGHGRRQDLEAAEVGPEDFGYAQRAVLLLVGLQQGDQDARRGQTRAVESVGQDGLAIGSARADGRAARLEVLEVGAGADFEPFPFHRSPHLEVVALGGTEAHVARAQEEPAEGEAELADKAFRLGGEDFVRLVALLRCAEPDHLDLVELVQAQEALGVLAVAAGLAAEAGGVGAVLDGHFPGVEDFVRMQVRDGDLGRGDEVQIVFLAGVQLIGELGQVAGAGHGGAIDHEGGLHFQETRGAVFVEEPGDQGAFQPGAPTGVHGEARPGDLGSALEVEQLEGFADLQMVLGPRGGVLDFAPGGGDHVLFAGAARRHRFVRQVGEAHEDVLELLLGGGQLRFGFGLLVSAGLDRRDRLGSVLPFALELADFGGGGVLGGLGGFHHLDQAPTGFVKLREAVHGRIQAAAPPGGLEEFGIVADETRVDHGKKDSGSLVPHPVRDSFVDGSRRGAFDDR